MLWMYKHIACQEWQICVPEVCNVQVYTFTDSMVKDLTNAKGQERQCAPEARNIRSQIDGTSHEM